MTIPETAPNGMKGRSITWNDLTWVDVHQPSRAEMEGVDGIVVDRIERMGATGAKRN